MRSNGSLRPRGWQGLVLIFLGALLGGTLLTPAVAHVGGWLHNWNQHIKPRADARYLGKVARPGQVLSGSLSVRYVPHASNPFILADGSFPSRLPVGTPAPNVSYLAGTTSVACPGVGKASPGRLCIYGYNTENIDTLNESGVATGVTHWLYGFSLDVFVVDATIPGYLIANWAYKVPSPLAAPARATPGSSPQAGRGSG